MIAEQSELYRCYKCKEHKSIEEMAKNGKRRPCECRACDRTRSAAKYAANPEKHKQTIAKCVAANPEKYKQASKANYLKRIYSLTLDAYAQLLTAQDGVCAICHQPEPNKQALSVDHDHATGRLRGLLCGSCNRGIGLLQDSPAIITAALDYIQHQPVELSI